MDAKYETPLSSKGNFINPSYNKEAHIQQSTKDHLRNFKNKLLDQFISPLTGIAELDIEILYHSDIDELLNLHDTNKHFCKLIEDNFHLWVSEVGYHIDDLVFYLFELGYEKLLTILTLAVASGACKPSGSLDKFWSNLAIINYEISFHDELKTILNLAPSNIDWEVFLAYIDDDIEKELSYFGGEDLLLETKEPYLRYHKYKLLLIIVRETHQKELKKLLEYEFKYALKDILPDDSLWLVLGNCVTGKFSTDTLDTIILKEMIISTENYDTH
jgi:hypothetical protein